MKGRSAGTISSVFRTMQDAFESSAKKAHEYIIEEKEKIDVSESSNMTNDKPNLEAENGSNFYINNQS